MSDEKRKVETLNPDGDRVDEITILKGERDALAARLAEVIADRQAVWEAGVANTRRAEAAEARVLHAFEMGWNVAAGWAGREDLLHDIGSPQYIKDRTAALGTADSAGAVQEEGK